MIASAKSAGSLYDAALARLVRPGIRVLDLGGDFARRAFVACRLGAECVYSVQSPFSCSIAREVAEVNGYLDRIQFIEAASDVRLQAVDLVLARLGVDASFDRGSLLAARRDPASGGRSIGATTVPRRERLWAAVVEAPVHYRRHAPAWIDHGLDLDLTPALKLATNAVSSSLVLPKRLLSRSTCLADLSFDDFDGTRIVGAAKWEIASGGAAHGLAVWSEVDFADGVGSGGSDQPDRLGGWLLLPWPQELVLQPADTVSVQVRVDDIAGQPIWSWHSRISSPAFEEPHEFQQSTFFAAITSTRVLQKAAADYRPTLTEAGRAQWMALRSRADARLTGGGFRS